MQIQLRPYHKQDFQPLEKIIRETWHYDRFCGRRPPPVWLAYFSAAV